VGIATALVMWLCSVGDPILWGAIAFLLNYVPILGPMTASMIFLGAGLLSVDTLWGRCSQQAFTSSFIWCRDEEHHAGL
jgi:predicted PurR-regulated permease PerM